MTMNMTMMVVMKEVMLFAVHPICLNLKTEELKCVLLS